MAARKKISLQFAEKDNLTATGCSLADQKFKTTAIKNQHLCKKKKNRFPRHFLSCNHCQDFMMAKAKKKLHEQGLSQHDIAAEGGPRKYSSHFRTFFIASNAKIKLIGIS